VEGEGDGGDVVKVLATLHPSFIQYGQWHQLMHLRDDLEKAQKEALFPEVRVRKTYYITQPTPAQAREYLKLGDRRPLILDIETTMDTGELICCGVAREPCEVVCLPWREPYISMLRSALLDPASMKVGHNSESFDFPRLEKALNIKVRGARFDTILAHAACKSDLRHGLAFLGLDYYDGEPWKGSDVDSLELYCCKDVDVTARAQVELDKLLDTVGVRAVYERTLRLMPTLVKMHEWGVGIDLEAQAEEAARIEEATGRAAQGVWAVTEHLHRVQAGRIEAEAAKLEATAAANWVPGQKREMGKLKTKAKRMRKEALKLTQPNLSSPSQLKRLLYEEMGLPVQRKKEGRRQGPVTTEDAALLELLRLSQSPSAKAGVRAAKPLLEALRDHRAAMALRKYVGFEEDRAHPEWLPYGAGTGRFSCQNPNMQNIPKRDEEAWRVRRIYRPVIPGNVITEADYSQIELRIQAWHSGDEAMLRAFREGVDIHRMLAARALSVKRGEIVKPEEVTPQERRVFKRAVYLESYGGGFMKLQAALATEGVYLTPGQAREVLELLQEARPQYSMSRDRLLDEAKKERMLRNPFGRVRWFLGPSYGDALNFPYQSTAADVIIDAMIGLEPELWDGVYLQAQVHDSLVVEHAPSETERVHKLLKEVMEQPVRALDGWVFPVDVSTGENWAMQ
jgi:DNA polymerase-1